jgi:hypothetical protein
MHREVLRENQKAVLDVLKLFSKDYFLAGGTAIALHIGHRYSIDFDLFTNKPFKKGGVKNLLAKHQYPIQQVLFEDSTQLHCIIQNVKISFLEFPYPIQPVVSFDGFIRMPQLKELAAMKAYALGGRAKWKDYVDMYFLLKNHFALNQIVQFAIEVFKDAFSEKLFRQQLTYYEDISFEEEVEYVLEPVSQNEIQRFLTDCALQQF